MTAYASQFETYDEIVEDASRRSNFQKIRPPNATRMRSRKRKSTVNKVGCGFAARRHKRWSW
jgi:hypothetical protein